MICPHCGQNARVFLRATTKEVKPEGETFLYHACPNCGLIFLRPIPANLSDYYADDYYAYQTPTGVEQLADMLPYQENAKLELVQGYKANGRLLDVGAGYGGFVYRAKNAGYDGSAIEMSPRCCAFLRDHVGVTTYPSSDPAATLATLGSYDVITLWHVIEHLADPFAMIDAIADHLAPGGIMVIGAPNPDSFQFHLFKTRWQALEAPRHVQFIPGRLIAARAESHGLVTRLVTSYDAMSVRADYTYWYEHFTAPFANPTLKRIGRIVGGGLRKIAKPFEQRGERGSYITVICQKPAI